RLLTEALAKLRACSLVVSARHRLASEAKERVRGDGIATVGARHAREGEGDGGDGESPSPHLRQSMGSTAAGESDGETAGAACRGRRGALLADGATRGASVMEGPSADAACAIVPVALSVRIGSAAGGASAVRGLDVATALAMSTTQPTSVAAPIAK